MGTPTPMNRTEQYLNRIANGSGQIPERPLNRLEEYLNHIAEEGLGDSVSVSGTGTSTDDVSYITINDTEYRLPSGTGKEDTSNKVTSLSSTSTDTEYPSAKCVYDELEDKQNKLIAGSNIALTPQQSGEVEISATGNTTTTSTNASITLTNNNTIIVTNQPTALAITLPSATSGIDYNCGVIFQAGASFALTETAPSGCTIVYDSTPTFTEANIYEINYRYLGIGGVISAICHEVAYE